MSIESENGINQEVDLEGFQTNETDAKIEEGGTELKEKISREADRQAVRERRINGSLRVQKFVEQAARELGLTITVELHRENPGDKNHKDDFDDKSARDYVFNGTFDDVKRMMARVTELDK